ncbi:hypothetical protein EDB83DRAFT_2318201 [Lactarius deliciosus]|nr:hypothetical protein EDB83DRAFT_2318201 [Lactarius deliciosus]
MPRTPRIANRRSNRKEGILSRGPRTKPYTSPKDEDVPRVKTSVRPQQEGMSTKYPRAKNQAIHASEEEDDPRVKTSVRPQQEGMSTKGRELGHTHLRRRGHSKSQVIYKTSARRHEYQIIQGPSIGSYMPMKSGIQVSKSQDIYKTSARRHEYQVNQGPSIGPHTPLQLRASKKPRHL